MLDIDEKIFRAYDIRGTYPDQVNSELAYLIGRSLVRFLRDKAQKNDLQVVLSRDGRLSSEELYQAAKKGILEEGADVIALGLAPTTSTYFAVWYYGYDGGLQITASHNPSQFNGFKLIQKEARLIAGNTGIDQIKEKVLKLAQQPSISSEGRQGKTIEKEVSQDYLSFNLKRFDLAKLKPFKMVIDTANGASGPLMQKLAEKLPGQVLHLFPEVDGSFPNHPPDPCKPENMQALIETVKEKQADIGMALDADGDRLFLVDEQGKIVFSSQTFSLIVEDILKEHPGEKFVYNIFMSRAIPELLKEKGGVGFMVRVGFTFLKEKMRQERAIFGGEQTGHFGHREHGFIEAPIFVLLTVLKVMSKSSKKLSELVSPFKKYYGTDININLEVKDKQQALKVLEEKYQGKGRISYLDGIRIDFEDWWFCARPSNTEDLLRIMLEAKSKEEYQKKKQELMQLLANC